MEKVTHINSFISSLPRIRKVRKLRTWKVAYKGENRGVVRADNESQALGYISTEKYPERDMIVLTYIGWSTPRV